MLMGVAGVRLFGEMFPGQRGWGAIGLLASWDRRWGGAVWRVLCPWVRGGGRSRKRRSIGGEKKTTKCALLGSAEHALFLQWFILDVDAPAGVSMSQGLHVVVGG